MSINAKRSVIENLISRAKEYGVSEPEKIKVLAEEIIRIATEEHFRELRAEGFMYLSKAITILKGTTEAVTMASHAVELLKYSDNKELLAKANNYLGICLRSNFQLSEAMEHFQIALDIYIDLGELKRESVILNNIGNTYKTIGLYDKAFDSYLEAIKIVGNSNNIGSTAVVNNNIGNLLLEHDDPRKALPYFRKSLELSRKAELPRYEGNCLICLGELETVLGHFEKAEEHFLNAIEIWNELSRENDYATTLYHLARLKEAQGKDIEAESHLIEAVEVSDSSQNPRIIARAESNLAIFRIRKGKTSGTGTVLRRYLTILSDEGDDLDRKTGILRSLSEFYRVTGEQWKALDIYKQMLECEQKLTAMQNDNDVVQARLRLEFQRSLQEKELLKVQKEELRVSNETLRTALEKLRVLNGLLPICYNCKKIRNDKGYWEMIEKFISEHSGATFTHAICPECEKLLYPDLATNSNIAATAD